MKQLSGLYAITEDGVHGDSLLSRVEAALSGGCRILQYRDKSSDAHARLREARQLLDLCESFQARLIINDDLELCRESQAHGVHLGRDDTDLPSAREYLGKDRIIGISCYNDLRLARGATAAGADYVAFGAIYPSSTKPTAVDAGLKLISQAKSELTLPIVAIGGITPENALPVIQAGADMVAMIQGLFVRDDIELAAENISKLFRII